MHLGGKRYFSCRMQTILGLQNRHALCGRIKVSLNSRKPLVVRAQAQQYEQGQRRRPDYIPNRIDDPNYVRIFDTTLRDGEQSPGATLTSKEKLEIAKQLSKLGMSKATQTKIFVVNCFLIGSNKCYSHSDLTFFSFDLKSKKNQESTSLRLDFR